MTNTIEITKLHPQTMYAEMQRRLPILQHTTEEWLQKMMRWHFDEQTGSPYWLRKKQTLDFDPIRDIRTLEDVKRFGLFDKTDLQKLSMREFLPRGFANQPHRVFETGGSTGKPCRILDVTTGQNNVTIYETMLAAHGLDHGDAIAMTPSGPHAYGTFVKRLMARWHGEVYYIDFDPRWVKSLARRGQPTEPYVDHLLEQTLDLLETQQATFLFSTTKLLMALIAKLDKPLSEYGIKAVCTGGTGLTPEESRYIRENHLQDIHWFDTYGNTLMGHALQAEPWEGLPDKSYYLPPPLGFIRVINPKNWTCEVERGQRGRVLLITLLEDLFIPNLLERDSAIRVGPHPWYPWDGVTAVSTYVDSLEYTATEGVY
jgi:phenylacetate-coenzyme A ligase PaaK-like adenylate-forming protein